MSIQIETERLVIREITVEDTPDMFRMYTNPEVHKYTGEPMMESLEEMESAIRIRTETHKELGYGRWATIRKSDGEFLGWSGLAYLEEFDEIDIGYRFFPEFWGNGYATESAEAVLKYGFETLKLKKIIAIAMNENKASINVMEKIGMQFDKFAPYDPGGEDVIWYQLKREDWVGKA